jgi:hypothetical protein
VWCPLIEHRVHVFRSLPPRPADVGAVNALVDGVQPHEHFRVVINATYFFWLR